MIAAVHCILYVDSQEKSTAFYTAVLGGSPTLQVDGMTEFRLSPDTVLGLMPATAIRALLGNGLPDPASAAGTPRAEVYLYVDDPEAYHERALKYGARELSPPQRRNWGDVAGYLLDLDGHVIAFAARGV
jgi:uncharacterized protein